MPANTLLTAVRAHLKLAPTHSVIIEPLKKGASGRTILRLRPDGHPTFIGMHYDSDRPDNASFLPVARFLQSAKINVPEVLYDHTGRCIALVEDLGDDDLLSMKNEPWEIREPIYRSAFEQLDRLFFTRPPKDFQLQPPFDAALYEWEQDYFFDHFVDAHLGMDVATLRNHPALKKLRENLGISSPNLVHRDFQSQNIIAHDGKAWIIDFQGLRRGRQEYDLASLMFDPYMNHSDEEVEKLLDLWENVSDERPIEKVLHDCAAQRLMQALGAFAKIHHESNNKDEWYKEMIPAGVHQLKKVIRGTDLEEALMPILEKAEAAQ